MHPPVSTVKRPASPGDREVYPDEPVGSLEERVDDLRLASPAAYVAVARHVDRLELEGTPRDAALRRALRALGR